MHRTESLSIWRNKKQGEKVRSAWKDKSSRSKLLSKWRASIRDKCLHLNPKSSLALRHHAQYANNYKNVRRFLDPVSTKIIPMIQVRKWRGGQDWAGGFGPYHEILDENHKQIEVEDFVDLIFENVQDPWGRLHKSLARKGIRNPVTPIQKMLRHLALHAPEQATLLFDECFRFLRARLRQEFPGVPVQLAFHVTTGRPHWEWLVPKYGRSGKLIRRDSDWDGRRRTVEHAYSFLKRGIPASGHAPKLNSRIEMDFYRMVIRRLRKIEMEVPIPPCSKIEMTKADLFFWHLQQASLLDGIKSRNARRARKAQKELLRNQAHIKKFEHRLKALLSKQEILKGAPQLTQSPGKVIKR